METKHKKNTSEYLPIASSAPMMHYSTANALKNRIAQAQIGNKLTRDNLGEAIVKTIALCGIKGEVGVDQAVDLKDTYLLKYSEQLTIDDFLLAFKMNESGFFEKRIEHYHEFTKRFMTDVLDTYIEKRKKYNDEQILLRQAEEEKQQEATKKLSIVASHNALLQEIIKNHFEANRDIQITNTAKIKDKLNVLFELCDEELTDSEIDENNLESISVLISRKTKRLSEIAFKETKEGERIDLKREIGMLKEGRWSDKLENEMQAIFKEKCYVKILKKLPDIFCKHVEGQLK